MCYWIIITIVTETLASEAIEQETEKKTVSREEYVSRERLNLFLETAMSVEWDKYVSRGCSVSRETQQLFLEYAVQVWMAESPYRKILH